MIKGWTSNSSVENHLIVTQGGEVAGNGEGIQDAINAMINVANAQPNMNYIVSVNFEKGIGNWIAKGTPVQFTPEP